MADEWVAVADPNSGRTYYANLRTRETRWDQPPGFQPNPQQQFTYQSESMLSGVRDQPSQSSFYSQSMSNFHQQPDMGYQQQQAQPQYGSFYGQQPQQQQQRPQAGSFYGQQQQVPSQQSGSFYGQQALGGAGQGGSFYGGGGGAMAHMQQGSSAMSLGSDAGGINGTRWRKAHDPSSGKDYYYHMDTKETQWTMPAELANAPQASQANMTKRLSAQMAAGAMISTQSMTNFQTQAWESDEDDDEDDESGSDSWGDDAGDDSKESSSADDGLQAFEKKPSTNFATNVKDDISESGSEDEAKAFNPLGDDEDVLVQDDSNKYWVVGETQGEKYRLVEYAKRYFQVEKHKKGMFKKMGIQDLLSFSVYKRMSNAMRKLDGKLNAQAKQTWKNINSYMGTRKSGKKDFGHVDKLLRFALKAPEELRDEIYCQLVKQTTKCPKAPWLIKAWKLMCICCSVFPPSDEFACYLAVYLYSETKQAGEVGELAAFALRALDRTMEVGQRRSQPTKDEVQRIENLQPISVQVYFLDGTFRVLLVTSQTRAAQVEHAIAEALGMQHAESFGLFEMEEPTPGWHVPVYERRQGLDRQAKIDGLTAMPLDRELEMNERIMDVMASWKRSKKKQGKDIRFVFKCKLFSKAQEASYSRHGWRIAFVSAVWHVLQGLYVVEEKHAFPLAALQMQATFGVKEPGFYVPGVILDSVEKYLSFELRKKYTRADEVEGRILQKHGMYAKLDKIDAYRKYIELLRKDASPQYFGNVFFRCVRVSRVKKQTKDEQDDLVIGISENGVIFVHPLTQRVVERYKMEEILTYGFRSNAFLFVAGTLMTQRKYQFATMLGKQMNDLLRAHIDLRVQQAEIQGYNITQ